MDLDLHTSSHFLLVVCTVGSGGCLLEPIALQNLCAGYVQEVPGYLALNLHNTLTAI